MSVKLNQFRLSPKSTTVVTVLAIILFGAALQCIPGPCSYSLLCFVLFVYSGQQKFSRNARGRHVSK